MKFNISSKEFFSVVSKLQGVIDKKTAIPLLSNLLLCTEDQSIIITGTDLGIGIKIECMADIIDQGKVTVSARKLNDILKEIPEGNLSFEAASNNWVHISCQNSRFKLASLSAENYPVVTDFSTEKKYMLNPGLFREMTYKTEYAISHETNRLVFTGIQFMKVNGQLKMTATDGHRLAIIKRPFEEEMADFELIIPKKTCREILNLIDEGEDKLLFSWTESKVMFQCGKTQLVSNLIEGKYPNMEKAIPKIDDKVLVFNRTAIISAIKRVSVFADTVSWGIRFDLNKDRLTVSSSDPEIGEAQEELEVSYDGPSFTVGFNSHYLLEILSVLHCEDVTMKFTDATSSALIVDPDDKEYVCLIMPMRI
ncbi:DNA polymerase III subunit beta [bacterium]|nr:DNA polymerase III subunit beta [bacterium]